MKRHKGMTNVPTEKSIRTRRSRLRRRLDAGDLHPTARSRILNKNWRAVFRFDEDAYGGRGGLVYERDQSPAWMKKNALRSCGVL